ncbi:hypothetical protein FT663_05196 [Candidozyma haemuli var. vulneris]|uniref:PX domain-containing protein n=1 Tax=Candidozyma haemuli TaxID=45357 RepID=A0A2V1APG7_9ASCO|nr:hypothetical protein CXQ85_001141 [[Candida] haemuloni]KAF3985696.1 hypothetical protein FT663_05196 [[Candida] haemuloni var. vulneris]KAF3990344.1 hypothetical protein FT662_02337 [[Candida] haemuloni var. vulneris]PVH18851.1 hypothetical protein CXQ85_001141 [[Candida] haemuloni]
MSNLEFIDSFSPTQEHFLRKALLECCIKREIHWLSVPNSASLLGPPFRSINPPKDIDLPILRHFFLSYVKTFPLIASNPEMAQIEFWRDTVHPFVDSFNQKHISDSIERKESITKRHQINSRLSSVLILFYNSMIVSKKEFQYLESDHLKDSDKGKLDKLSRAPNATKQSFDAFQGTHSLEDYGHMVYSNNININIVAVDMVNVDISAERSTWTQMWKPVEHKRKSHYLFVLQVTFRDGDNGDYTYKSHFISKSYSDFKRLETDLKKKYPGLMTTDISKLPRKLKHDGGHADEDGERRSSSDSSSTASTKSKSTKPSDQKYHREKLRLALRGYLATLLAKPEIAHCDVFRSFVDDPKRNFKKLSPSQEEDSAQRMELEKRRLMTQIEFQEETAKSVFELSKRFEKFKAELLENPESLTQIFKDFSQTKSLDEVSPLLKTFFEWCKLEIAATLYQMFLSQDNSSEWFRKCFKFHKMFPYSVCYGILKYTNPVKVMTRMVDVLLVSVPSVNMPWAAGDGKKKVNNLLSMIFIMLLDEDLEDYSKERTKLLEEAPLSSGEYKPFIERIRTYVASHDVEVADQIKEESLAKDENLLLTIFQTNKLEPKLSSADWETYKKVAASYEKYVSMDDHKQVDDAAAFVALQQLWQLEVRSRDKRLMKQLWKEPELTKLIKKFLVIFYNPLMTVMKQCEIHLAFKDFQHFMDDLMEELKELDEGGIYFTSPVEIFNRFKALLNKHEKSFWRMLRDLYLKDDKKIFTGLITWIESFLVALRRKETAPESVMVDFLTMNPKEDVNKQVLEDQVNQRIEATMEKRRIIQEYLKKQAHKKESDTEGVSKDQAAINARWEKLNNGLFEVENTGFGVDGEDYDELELAKLGDLEEGDQEAQHLLRDLARFDKAMEQNVSEIEKLAPCMHRQIHSILDKLPLDKRLEQSTKELSRM